MTQVMRHKAQDGSLHEHEHQCERRDVDMRRLKMFKDFCAKKIISAPKKSRFVTIDGGLNFVIKLDHLPDFLVENAHAVQQILTKSLVKPIRYPRPGRPRRSINKPSQPQAGA